MNTLVVDYSHIHSGEFKENVYCPSEDTFLFVDALQRDVEFLRSCEIALALEIGSGSGYISTYLLMLLCQPAHQTPDANTEDDICVYSNDRIEGVKHKHQHGKDVPMVIALDINRFANMATLTTAQRNRTADNINAVTMDMFSALSSCRCKAMVDLILFNPPYVPSNDDDCGGSSIDLAWNGGHMGRDVIDRFINSVGVGSDTRHPLLVEKRNDVSSVLNMIAMHGFHAEIILSRQIIGETLYIIRFSRV
ncbi:Methyltransferase domain-containing protein [Babesia divergens]|uniref:Methyltransferase domain-containing protein n=1 Tax=Babesia divergens TaxID=32595 RepID=A0AAD9LJA1_BABDI|nr:Methyltransferase domain-containing protein [Babesia divergens]